VWLFQLPPKLFPFPVKPRFHQTLLLTSFNNLFPLIAWSVLPFLFPSCLCFPTWGQISADVPSLFDLFQVSTYIFPPLLCFRPGINKVFCYPPPLIFPSSFFYTPFLPALVNHKSSFSLLPRYPPSFSPFINPLCGCGQDGASSQLKAFPNPSSPFIFFSPLQAVYGQTHCPTPPSSVFLLPPIVR